MQPIKSKSSIETEYHVFGYIVAKIISIRKLVYDLGITIWDLVCLFCDNISATCMYVNQVQHAHNKHITVDYHCIEEQTTTSDFVIYLYV